MAGVLPEPDPFQALKFDDLEAYASKVAPGHFQADLGLAVSSGSDPEARLRAAYGISQNIDAFAQAQIDFGQQTDVGAEVGLAVHF